MIASAYAMTIAKKTFMNDLNEMHATVCLFALPLTEFFLSFVTKSRCA